MRTILRFVSFFGLAVSLLLSRPALSSAAAFSNPQEPKAQQEAKPQDAKPQDAKQVLSEQALRSRLDGFYGLMQLGRYQEGEAFITPETRPNFEQQRKNAIVGFEVLSINFEPGPSPKKADVVIRVNVFSPPATVPIPSDISNTWVIVKGVWMMEAPKVKVVTFQQLTAGAKGGFPHAPTPPEEVKFDTTTASFGKVDRGTKVTLKFPFKNVTNHPVSLAVDTYCECLVVKGLKKDYKPGESAELVVNFDTEEFMEEYAQTIIVKSKPGGAETRLLITGYIPRNSAKQINDKPGSNF